MSTKTVTQVETTVNGSVTTIRETVPDSVPSVSETVTLVAANG